MPSHYLNQWLIIVNWNPRNKLQWNLIWNSSIFIQENPFENVFWKMVAILPRPQWVNMLGPEQNSCHLINYIFVCIFLTKNLHILNEISLKFIPKVLMNKLVIQGLNNGLVHQASSLLEPVMTKIHDAIRALPAISELISYHYLAMFISICPYGDDLTFFTPLLILSWNLHC